MILDKLYELAFILLDKTLNKKVIWVKGSSSNQFQVYLPNDLLVTIDAYAGSRSETIYSMDVFNNMGNRIKSYNSHESIISSEQVQLIKDLQEAASDQYYKVDDTLSDLIDTIKDAETVGTGEPPTPYGW